MYKIDLTPQIVIESNEERIFFTTKLETTDIHLKEGAKLTFVALVSHGWDGKKTLSFHFEGKNSIANCLLLIVGNGREKFTFETLSNHKVPQTKAYYYVRNVLFDQSMVDYFGNLIIQKEAQMTDAYLAHHSLMMSKDAKTYTIPSLEIEADDVKAGHAATVGNVDEELLFYLTSRGIERRAAEELLIKNFMQSDFEKISSKKLRIMLSKKIEQIFSK